MFARRAPIDHWFGVSLALTTVLLFLLSLGEFAPYAPADARAPRAAVFEFQDSEPLHDPVPAVCGAHARLGVRSIVTRYGFAQSARIAVAIVALGASAHLIVVNQWNLRNVFTEAPFDTSFHWMGGPRQITTTGRRQPIRAGVADAARVDGGSIVFHLL